MVSRRITSVYASQRTTFGSGACRAPAETMECGQDEISKLERRADMLVSTLRRYIEGDGGGAIGDRGAVSGRRGPAIEPRRAGELRTGTRHRVYAGESRLDRVDCATSGRAMWSSPSPMARLAAARERIAGAGVGRRDVEVEGRQFRAASIADLVRRAALDQQQGPSTQ